MHPILLSLLSFSPRKTIKNGRDQHFQESTLGGFREVSVTRVRERGRGVYYEKIEVWKFRLVNQYAGSEMTLQI